MARFCPNTMTGRAYAMARIAMAVAIIAFLAAPRPAPARAAAAGVYAEGAYDFSSFDQIVRSSTSVDYGVGAGLVFDTNVSGKEKMNYRIRAGYAHLIDHGVRFFSIYSMHRVSLNAAFGFGIVRDAKYRVWLGPEMGAACQFNTFAYKTTLLIFTIGPVLGLNFNAGGNVTIGFELGMAVGFGWNLMYSERSRNDLGGLGYNSRSSDFSNETGLVKIESVARVSVLFRVGKAGE